MLDQFVDWIAQSFSLNQDTAYKLLVTLAALMIIWLIRKLLLRAVLRQTTASRTRYLRSKGSEYVAMAVGFAILILIWFDGFTQLVTYFGLVSAGIAIALRDPITNLVGWFFILWRRPFWLGDRVQIGDHAGDVVDVRIFTFTLLEIGNWVNGDQSTGRVIYVPNGQVFTQMLANYGKGLGYIWNEISVLVTFESDWQVAKKILQGLVDDCAEDHSQAARENIQQGAHYLIKYANFGPRVYTSVMASGVLLTMRYLCSPKERRTSEEVLWEGVLNAFGQHKNINLAYPTQRFYTNASEVQSS